MKTGSKVVLSIAALAAAAGVFWLVRPPAPERTAAPAPAPAAPAAPASAPAAPPEPAIAQPIEPPVTQAPLEPSEIGPALTELFGRKAVMSFLQIDEFPRRFVATVDNLGRSHAPPMLWPVNPTPDRFTVVQGEGAMAIADENSQRYTPLLLLAETVDVPRAVDLYVRMYPLLQRTYEELGFPRRQFNDRLIAVIDQLLATPEPKRPLNVELTEVKGPIPSVRPWVRYTFADPELESLSAGQKILLRVGAVNGRRLKAKLAEIREELVRRGTRR
ncbi:MAG TPA: DUF3014 domain-containing protein [Ramlibacter sp.]|jgi:hypothetical protein